MHLYRYQSYAYYNAATGVLTAVADPNGGDLIDGRNVGAFQVGPSTPSEPSGAITNYIGTYEINGIHYPVLRNGIDSRFVILADVTNVGWPAVIDFRNDVVTQDFAVDLYPLDGTAGDDLLIGIAANDTINGLAGDDTLNGGAGDDLLQPGDGNDTVEGGSGSDTVVIESALRDLSFSRAATSLTVEITSPEGTDVIASDVEFVQFHDPDVLGRAVTRSFAELAAITFVDGTPGSEALAGTAGADVIDAQGGADWITPGPGNDTVDGGAGNDMISFVNLAQAVTVNLGTGFAASGGDRNLQFLTGDGGPGSTEYVLRNIEGVTGTIFADLIIGSDGDDRLRGLGDYDWFTDTAGADSYDGGTGRDMVSYVTALTGVRVDLGTGRGDWGQATGDTYTGIERITGSVNPDLLIGGAGEEDFRGLGGYDWFVGSGGGRDRYDGGSGLDMVSYAASGAGVVASLLLGRGSGGDAARDLYTSIERLTGSSFDDVLTGDNGRNELRGLYGEDRIFGNGGVDRITGGGSDDYIDGGSGWDYAYFAGDRAEYTITRAGAQVTVDRIAPGGDGTDTLVNIEVAVFADGDVIL